MNDQLVPSSGVQSGLPAPVVTNRRDDRLVARQVAGLERVKRVELARLEVEAQLSAARTQVVSYVGQQAMQAVTMVSQLELQLAEVCPFAMERLHTIGDMTALSLAQVVADSARHAGR